MAVTKPYRRTCRQFLNGSYSEGGKWMYPLHPAFARDKEQYVRAYLLLQNDLLELFEYVEPSDLNLPSHSFRTHGLLMRTCIELEANWKAILRDNNYSRAGDWNRSDYRKIDRTHLLSGYEVKVPNWRGNSGTFKPFGAWASGSALTWYDAYNSAKHDRHSQFQDANLENLLGAFTGLAATLPAQFYTNDFQPVGIGTEVGGPPSGWDTAIGGFFWVKFPQWPMSERYDFEWQTLKSQADPFQDLTF